MGRHNCNAVGCKLIISTAKLMCPTHWGKVPADLQREVYATFRAYDKACAGDEGVEASKRAYDWAMHVAGVDRSQVPQRTLHPARIVALARITVRSRTRTYHDAKPSLIAREGWNVRPPHHIEFEACWCQWTARGVLAWAKGEAFSPADVIVALNAVETRARFEPMHQRALRRFLDAMVVRKLLVAAGRGRYRAAEGAAP